MSMKIQVYIFLTIPTLHKIASNNHTSVHALNLSVNKQVDTLDIKSIPSIAVRRGKDRADGAYGHRAFLFQGGGRVGLGALQGPLQGLSLRRLRFKRGALAFKTLF
jgi:hypothetical protein